ncbi:hypothetical protein [Dapis sp. BLCC M229]
MVFEHELTKSVICWLLSVICWQKKTLAEQVRMLHWGRMAIAPTEEFYG